MTPTAEIKAQDIVVEDKKNSLTELKGKLDRETLGALAEKLEQKLDAFDKNIKTKISDSCTNLLDDKTKTLTDPQRIALNKVKDFLKPKIETRTKEQINTIKTKAPTDKFSFVEGGKPDRQYKKSEDGKTLYAKDKEGKNFQKYNEDSHTRTFLADFQIKEKGTTEKYNINRQEIKDALTSVTNSSIAKESIDLIISALNNPNKENITSLQTFLKENISDTDRVATNEKFLKDGKFGPKTQEALTKYLTEESSTENKKLETTKKSNETSIDLTNIENIIDEKDEDFNTIKKNLKEINADLKNIGTLDGYVTQLIDLDNKIENSDKQVKDGKITAEAGTTLKTKRTGEKDAVIKKINELNPSYIINPKQSLQDIKLSLTEKVATVNTLINETLNTYKTKISEIDTDNTIQKTSSDLLKEQNIDSKSHDDKIIANNTMKDLIGKKERALNTVLTSPIFKENQSRIETTRKQKEAEINTTINGLNNTADWTKYGTQNPGIEKNTNYIKQGEMIKENELKEIKKPIANELLSTIKKIPGCTKEGGELTTELRILTRSFAREEEDLIKDQTKLDNRRDSEEKIDTLVAEVIGLKQTNNGKNETIQNINNKSIGVKEQEIIKLGKELGEQRKEISTERLVSNVEKQLKKVNKIGEKIKESLPKISQADITKNDQTIKDLQEKIKNDKDGNTKIKNFIDNIALTAAEEEVQKLINTNKINSDGITAINTILGPKMLSKYPEKTEEYFAMRDGKSEIDPNTKAGDGKPLENVA